MIKSIKERLADLRKTNWFVLEYHKEKFMGVITYRIKKRRIIGYTPYGAPNYITEDEVFYPHEVLE